MHNMVKIAFDQLLQDYHRVIQYASKTADSFSVITEQVKPYSISPPNCKHDEMLYPISNDLIRQEKDVKSWPGTRTSAKHMVMNVYRMTRATRKWLRESPNLFLKQDNVPEDICFYRSGNVWMYVISHERDMAIMDPTKDDLLFFKVNKD